jgi:hypothetical protein
MKKLTTSAALGCLTLLSPHPGFSQFNQATISGAVTDAQGAAISGATVAAAGIATGVRTQVATNDSGFYAIPNLPVGAYTLTIEHPGFRRYVRENLTLSTGETLGLDVRLELGAVTETVDVTAETPLVESRTSDVTQLIESRSISDLPLGDRRTMNAIGLIGAAVFVGYDATGQKPNFSLAGGRTQSQMFWIDGGTGQNMRMGIGQMDIDPPIDAVAEIKVLSNNYSAEYGGSAGGVVVETTKSGTNEFHGTVFEYFRNNKMDAPGFFAPIANGQKVSPELRSNVFGGSLGGPIRHNKTFFFGAYQARPRRTGAVQTVVAPTALQRAGDFSQTLSAGKLVPIYDPATTVTANGVSTRQQFPGNLIPASRLDPVGAKAIQYYPLPNVGVNTAQGNSVTGLQANFVEVKVDHNFNDKDKLTGRYIYDQENTSTTSIYPDPAADPQTFLPAHETIVHTAWTHILNPAMVNNVRFEFSDRYSHAETHGLGDDYASKLGLTGVSSNAFPNFAPAGYSALGATAQERRQFPIYQTEYVDDFSWVHAKHALKFGFEADRSENQELNLPTASGSFGFATLSTGLPGNAATGNALASLLLGVPNTFSENQTDFLDRKMWYLGAFVQDDWTVSPSLTLNLGLRWETDTPMFDVMNRFNGFDSTQINPVSGTPGVVKFMGMNGFRTSAYNGDWNNFGPRFGFAWKPFHSPSTVIRGGYGIFYTHPFDAGVPNQATLGFSTSIAINSPDNGLTFPFTLRQGAPPPTPQVLNDSFGAVAVGKTPTTAVTYFDPGRRTGYAHQFNLGVQHELRGAMVVEATFLSNDGRKLPNTALPIDQISPTILGPQHQSQADRPFPQFSGVSIIAPTLATSNYYAGMIRFEKRFSRGLNLVASYTRSKFLDNSTEAGSALGANNGPYSNYYNRRADYGYSANDIPNRFSFSSVYELPFGAGKRWLAAGPVAYVVGGWSLSDVTTVQSGPPVTVVTQTNTTNSFSSGSLRPNVLRDPNLSDRKVAQWFDTTAFAQPAADQFGSEGVGIVRAAGLVNFDISLQRFFKITERVRFQFRAEFFNAFNHTNFALPATTFGSPTFGQVTSAGPARQIELGMRIQF